MLRGCEGHAMLRGIRSLAVCVAATCNASKDLFTCRILSARYMHAAIYTVPTDHVDDCHAVLLSLLHICVCWLYGMTDYELHSTHACDVGHRCASMRTTDARVPTSTRTTNARVPLPRTQLTNVPVRSSGRRKVILATSVAETSVTVRGITAVVDSGLSRKAWYDPDSGMTKLRTVQASLSSCDQRAGRAGRVAPGVCFRVWDAKGHK